MVVALSADIVVVEAVRVVSAVPVVGEASTGRSGLSVPEGDDPDAEPEAEIVVEIDPDVVELSGGAVAALIVDGSVSGRIA